MCDMNKNGLLGGNISHPKHRPHINVGKMTMTTTMMMMCDLPSLEDFCCKIIILYQYINIGLLFFRCVKILFTRFHIMYLDTDTFVLHIPGDDAQLASQENTVSKKRKGIVILANCY